MTDRLQSYFRRALWLPPATGVLSVLLGMLAMNLGFPKMIESVLVVLAAVMGSSGTVALPVYLVAVLHVSSKGWPSNEAGWRRLLLRGPWRIGSAVGMITFSIGAAVAYAKHEPLRELGQVGLLASKITLGALLAGYLNAALMWLGWRIVRDEWPGRRVPFAGAPVAIASVRPELTMSLRSTDAKEV